MNLISDAKTTFDHKQTMKQHLQMEQIKLGALNSPDYIYLKFRTSAAIAIISVYRDYLRVTPLRTDTTLLNYNTILNERSSNNSF